MNMIIEALIIDDRVFHRICMTIYFQGSEAFDSVGTKKFLFISLQVDTYSAIKQLL